MRSVPQPVLDLLAQGGIVICANARAARALAGMHAGHMLASSGRRAWETPPIDDWQQWLHEQWKRLLLTGHEARTLLSPLQEEALWREIVRPGVEQRSLIAPADVARLAMTAYSLLSGYNATGYLQRSGVWDHPDLEPELFRRWALEMERRCERGRWLCGARLPGAIADAVRSGHLEAPPAILWNGFDRLTPADRALREVLAEAGCKQSNLAWQQEAVERLIAAPSALDEFEACARWARIRLDQDAQASIAILLPDVESSRAELDRVLRRVLSPQASGLNQHQPKPMYEFTLGLPLAQVPVISAALALLKWCQRPLEQQTITWMMTTGFFGRADEAAILAEADIKMRRKLTVPELEMEDALERLSKYATPTGGNWAVANWVQRMRRALAALKADREKRRSCPHWIAVISSALEAAGWPGEESADSIGFQIRDRWQRALDDLATLAFQDRRDSYAEFLGLLRSHLQSTIFSTESQGAPITVSGIPESAGRTFDAVWVLGATDEAWPAASRRNPLLPSWLQQEMAMPGSSAAQDRTLADAVRQRLHESTSELIFSYAKEGTEGAQRPSSLVAQLTEELAELVADKPSLLAEVFVDEMAVPWPGGRAAGGQEVLKAQSACPFKAFAGKRLGARELPSLEAGLSAAERGTVVHDVLAALWADERMRDSTHLSAALSGNLVAIVTQHVAAAFAKRELAASTEWERDYLQLEQARVCELVSQWLHYESGRRPFTVEQFEKQETILIEGLELNVRMDRVDCVERGRVLIDYKTGPVKGAAWESNRPEEPQLPIYAVSGKVEGLRDVLFAQVRAEETKFISAVYKSKSDLFPDNPTDPNADQRFREICAQWTESIHQLSREFQQGVATVTPKDYPVTCQYCDFPGLCRVAETSQASVSNNVEEEGEAE